MELLIVLMIVAILARMSLPVYHKLVLQARAGDAAGEIDAVRLAAFSYNEETGLWPRDVSGGVVPPELVPYLDEGFSFEREGYRFDWDNWTLPDGAPKHSEIEVLLGISMATYDAALGQAVLELVDETVTRFTVAEHYTFIVAAE